MTTTGHRSTIVREVISSAASGADVMSALPGLVRQMLDEEAWREFTVPGMAKPVRHETFTAFVKAPPPRGLGGRSTQLLALCGADGETRERVATMLRGEVPPAKSTGKPSGPMERPSMPNSSSSTEKVRDTHLSDSSGPIPKADTAERQLRRLKRDDPELAERVVKGQITANAAATAKGWRRPRIVVTTPERVAEHLRKHFDKEQRATLAALLLDG